MARQIHFEVFVRRGASKGWSLYDAGDNRGEALALAKTLMENGTAAGVKVVKEVFDDQTGGFQDLTIFEDGHKKFKDEKEEEERAHALPCFSPEDFYAIHARRQLQKLFADTLMRWKLTVSELIHRADMLEKLEAAGTVYQHAVQKVAVAQASGTGQDVVKIVRALNELAERAIQRVYKAERSKRAPAPEDSAALARFVRAEASAADADFACGMAFAKFLAPAKTWDEKLKLVLEAAAAAPPDAEGGERLLKLIDSVLAEILSGGSAVQELIGTQADLGGALIALGDLFLGKAEGPLKPLAAKFAKGEFPEAKGAVGRRVLSELKSHKRLAADVTAEIKHMRQITGRLVAGASNLLPHDDIVAAVSVRSRRLVQQDTVSALLTGAATPEAKIDRILMLAENVVGDENKRRCFDFIRPVLSSSALEDSFNNSAEPGLARFLRAGELAGRITRAGFHEAARVESAAVLDRLSMEIARRDGLFERFEQRPKADEAALALTLALARNGVSAPLGRKNVQNILRRRADSGVLLKLLAGVPSVTAAKDPAAAAAEIFTKAGFSLAPSAAA